MATPRRGGRRFWWWAFEEFIHMIASCFRRILDILQVLFAVVGLAKLYEPSAKVLVGVQVVLATALSTVAWMVR